MMRTTDTSEAALEALIVASLLNEAGYTEGSPQDYDPSYALDVMKLLAFLSDTQPDTYEALHITSKGHSRDKFLHRLQGEIARRGIIDVLRKGVHHGAHALDLFYATPTAKNLRAKELFHKNIFSVTRQLRYSNAHKGLALDMVVFINGLPIATFELKNKLTKQTVFDAVQQYKNDRDPKELLFQFGRCIAHIALDDHEVHFCTHLQGKKSWFLPFNKGYNDGAGNPPNPQGIATDYLWKETFSKIGLCEILENYAQKIAEKDGKTGKKTHKQIFPRYHQLQVVKLLLADALEHGAGQRYLIQHSAGSGKSNSIAWLAHQLVGLEKDANPVFGSIIVVTDRRVLDKQIKNTIKSFEQVGSIVGHSENSADLRRFIREGKKIIITTVQKFPFILDTIGDRHRDNTFAIIIDEAHSSQGGKTSAKMNMALAQQPQNEAGENVRENAAESAEDKINSIMQKRKMVSNASYFAFTATPKHKTLEIFGIAEEQSDGTVKHRAFHSYSMKQAIQEGFILDVLKSYTPIESYYHLAKVIEDDPKFDSHKARKKLRRYVESHDHAISEKVKVMLEHFHEQVMGQGKVGGKARAMVVTNGIERAIQYFHAFNTHLQERKSPYKAIVAFSGEYNYAGEKVTEASLNGFPSAQIPDKVGEEPYRFLIVADKFQTGYDEPLLHTMYVDKTLAGIKAVQTLSRLNRAHPQKHDTFVLDFSNDSSKIQASFAPYYRTTILSDATDPNKMHDLKADLDGYQVYAPQQIETLVTRYLDGAERDQLDPILDVAVATYSRELDEDGQVDFKSKAKAFIRTYGFLASILPYSNAAWEKLSIFLNFLVPKLPAPKEKDLARGILEAIDMDSYRVEARTSLAIAMADHDAEIDPVPTRGSSGKAEAEMTQLSHILQSFNDLFGNIAWQDGDKIKRVITKELCQSVEADSAYQNAIKNNDKKVARLEHDRALQRAMFELISDHTELFKQYSDNTSFKQWLGDTIFALTYHQ